MKRFQEFLTETVYKNVDAEKAMSIFSEQFSGGDHKETSKGIEFFSKTGERVGTWKAGKKELWLKN